MNNKANMRRRLIAFGVAGAILIGVILSAFLYVQYRNDQKTVEVLPVGNVAESYWGDQISTSGQVVSDYVQQLYPDSTKTISEVFVTEGQQVSIGTPLLQYDKTALDLEVEAKEIEVKQVDVKIDEAQRQLKKLQNTRPVSVTTPRPTRTPGSTSTSTPRPTRTPAATRTPRPSASPTPTKTPGPTNTPVPTPDVGVYSLLDLESVPYKGTGTTEDPYVFLCKNGYAITPSFFRHMLGLNQTTPTPEPTAEPTPEPTPEEPDVSDDPGSQLEWMAGGETVESIEKEDEAGTSVTEPDQVENSGFWQGSQDPDTKLVSPFAAVFEVREENSNYGNLVSSLKIDGTNYSAALTLNGLFNGMTAGEIVAGGTVEPQPKGATPTPKPTSTPTPNPSATPSNNYNDMGYTSAELNQLIKEKRREITNLQHDLKQANLDLEKAKRALENSTVLSTMEGQVSSLIDLDTALAENKPLLIVSGEQQYYVSGTISEAWLGSVNVGDTVTVNSWMTGQTYSAQIVSISDYPADQEGGYYGGESNPNSSSYEFTAVIQNPDSSLTANDYNYVDITMDVQDTTSAEGLYLQRPYLREDDSGFYVMKAGKNNRLVKQYVLVGKAIWGGQNMEIKSGLTYEDFVAFPYGADVKEGVRVVLQGTEGEKPWPDGLEEEPVSSGLLDDGLASVPDNDMAVMPDGGAAPDDGTAGDFGTDSAVSEEPSVPEGGGEEGITLYEENGGEVIP